MPSYEHLISGYRVFKATTYKEKKELIVKRMEAGFAPTTLVITSSGMKMGPEFLFASSPGDLYVVRNFGGWVPANSGIAANGTMSIIEYAISVMKVNNVVVLGHSGCDAVKELMSNKYDDLLNTNDKDLKKILEKKDIGPLATWMLVGKEVKQAVLKHLSDKTFEEQCAACEQEVILVSIKNLLGYKFVQERVQQGMDIYGLLWNINEDNLLHFNPNTKHFEAVD